MGFKKFYVRMANAKFVTGIYVMAHLFYFMLFEYLQGSSGLSFVLVFQLMAVSALLAVFHSLYLLPGFDIEKGVMQTRNIIWMTGSMLIVFAGIYIFGWYRTYDLIYMIVYVLVMILSLALMLVNMVYERQIDSEILNNELNEFKQRR